VTWNYIHNCRMCLPALRILLLMPWIPSILYLQYSFIRMLLWMHKKSLPCSFTSSSLPLSHTWKPYVQKCWFVHSVAKSAKQVPCIHSASPYFEVRGEFNQHQPSPHVSHVSGGKTLSYLGTKLSNVTFRVCTVIECLRIWSHQENWSVVSAQKLLL